MPSAIVLGSCPNGLSAALTLAAKGWDVQVLEPSAFVGGVAAGEPFADGYANVGTLHDDTLVNADFVRSLGLTDHGLELRDTPRDRWLAGDDGGIVLSSDINATSAQIRRFSARDADHWPEWRRFMRRGAGAIRQLLTGPPPDILDSQNMRTALQVAKAAVSVRALGRDDMFELLRAMPMAARDFAEDHFETPLLQAGLVGPGLLGTWGGPWSPGTTTPWMLREAAGGAGIVGGPAALVRALQSACSAAGVTVTPNAGVDQIVMASGRAAGVRLEHGETIAADVVMSALDPRTTLLDLIPVRHLSVRLEQQLSVFRCRGIVATLSLALDKRVPWANPPSSSGQIEHAHIGGSLAELERAFDPVKYGEDTEQPWLDVRVPTVENPALAPAGCDVVTVLATGFAALSGGAPGAKYADAPDEREDMAYDAIVDSLEAYAPGIGDSIVASSLRLPDALQRDFSLSGGHLWQGEAALDQLLTFRPSPTCAAGQTPIDGLWLCGGGIHPGGGVRTVNGVLAARRCLAAKSS